MSGDSPKEIRFTITEQQTGYKEDVELQKYCACTVTKVWERMWSRFSSCESANTGGRTENFDEHKVTY